MMWFRMTWRIRSSAPSTAWAPLRRHLRRRSAKRDSVKAIWKPNLTTQVDEDTAGTIMKMIAALDDDEDVQNVYANFEVSEEVMKKLTAA